MTGLTQQAIQQALGREIPEEILIIAKMAVVGMAPDRIAETLGSSKVEVEEILESQDYKDVRLLVGVEHARLSRSEEHTSELQSLMRISYAVFCLKKKKKSTT